MISGCGDDSSGNSRGRQFDVIIMETGKVYHDIKLTSSGWTWDRFETSEGKRIIFKTSIIMEEI
jgi:hypothetical protein